MRAIAFLTVLLIIVIQVIAQTEPVKKVMDGFPPSRESQVTLRNYREYPFNTWSFRNIGAPMHVLMLPRAGNMHQYKTATRPRVATMVIQDSLGTNKTFEECNCSHEMSVRGCMKLKDCRKKPVSWSNPVMSSTKKASTFRRYFLKLPQPDFNQRSSDSNRNKRCNGLLPS